MRLAVVPAMLGMSCMSCMSGMSGMQWICGEQQRHGLAWQAIGA
jgi:hypothetical protein